MLPANSYEIWKFKEDTKQKIFLLQSIASSNSIQKKWLFQFLEKSFPYLEKKLSFLQKKDPKILWALKNIHLFPIDLKKDSLEKITKVPGISLSCAIKIKENQKIIRFETLRKLGCNFYLAQHFIVIDSFLPFIKIRYHNREDNQLQLF